MKISPEKHIILFDGVCNLCNATVQTIIKIDKKESFVFASMQSESGQYLLNRFITAHTDSVILIKNKKAYIKSNAAIEIMREIGGLWKIAPILYIIPGNLRDRIYDFVARNRYKWFGKKDSCLIPSPDLKKRFLE